MSHNKRSHGFYIHTLELCQRLMGVHTKQDLMAAAKLLADNTTDSACMVLAKETEPIFVLKANDPLAAKTVAFWIEESRKAKLHASKIVDAQECLREMLEWKP